MDKLRFLGPLYLVIAIQLFLPLTAMADIGLPMLIVVWPASWILLFIIIPLEAMIAKKLLGLTVARSFILSGIANAVSTIVGIPITWLILVFGEIFLSRLLPALNLGGSYGTQQGWIKIFHTVLGSPWIAPTKDSDEAWIIPLAILSLCIPFCLASIWVENLIAKRFVNDKAAAFRWALIANLSSYGLIIIMLLILLLIGLWHATNSNSFKQW